MFDKIKLIPCKSLRLGVSHLKIGVKSVINKEGKPAKNGAEVDHLLRLPFKIKKSEDDN
jgi:hypothetical protein